MRRKIFRHAPSSHEEDFGIDPVPGGYYLDYEELAEAVEGGLYGPMDEDGIPLVDYDRWFGHRPRGGADGERLGVHYTPVTIAQYGLGLHTKARRTRDPAVEAKCIGTARWLVENLERHPKGFGVWLHHFRMPEVPIHFYYRDRAWVSGMAQGEGISLLVRVHRQTADPVFMEAADLAVGAFDHPLEKQGVCWRDSSGEVWFEEFPCHPPMHVLNGFVFALLGLLDHFRVTRSARSWGLWESGIATLTKHLAEYDCGFGTYYDLRRRRVVDPGYHGLHVAQLEVLHRLTGKDIFAAYRSRWDDYRRQPRYRLRWQCHRWMSAMRRRMPPPFRAAR